MVKLNIIFGILLVGLLTFSGCGGGVSSNAAPVADAGGTLQAFVGVQTNLAGSGYDKDSDDLEYKWSVTLGDKTKVNIVELNNPSSAVTFLEQGTYELNLNVYDGEKDDDDTLQVTVSSKGGNDSCFDSQENSDEEGIDCGGSCAITCTEENTYNTIFVAYVSKAPVIDGDLAEFSGAKSVSLKNERGVIGEYKFLWDKDNLYVAGAVFDNEIYTSITKDDGNLWVDDSIEMSFDTNKDRSSSFDLNDYKFFLSPANIILDSRGYNSGFNSGFTHATNIDGTLNEQSLDRAYYLELAIPWSAIGVSAYKDKELGFALNLNDRFEGGSYTQEAWFGSINSPSTFGTLILANGFVNNTPFCGNGKLENGEECDDNNLFSGDGCSSECQIEQSKIEGDMLVKPLPGNYEDVVHVWLESNIPGADIYYTTDGSIPTTNSKEYFGAIELRNSVTLKAIAVLPGTNKKEEFSGTYIISKSPSSISVNGNTFFEAEQTTNFKNFVARPDLTASNGEYMLVLDQQTSSDTYLSYDFNANPGTYYVWVRCLDQDSWGTIHLDVDGVRSTDLHCGPKESNVNGWGFHWIPTKSSGYALSGNNHKLKISKSWFTSKIDRVLITTDANYKPTELLLIRPAGGEVLLPSNSEEIKWESDGSLNNVKIEYSIDNGKTWQTIVSSTPNDGTYIWNTPSGTYSDVRVRISDVADAKSNDISDFAFRIQQNKEWYQGSEILKSRISYPYNKRYDPLKDDREAWLNKMEEMGAEQVDLSWSFNGIKLADYNPYNLYYDVEAMDRYRLKNNDKTILAQYGCLFSVNSLYSGEGWHIPPSFDSWTNNYPDEWILKDDKGNIVYNERNYGIKDAPECDYCKQTGKDCEKCKVRANLFFAHPDYIQDAILMINNMLSVGYDGAFFDSFSPLTISNFENGKLTYVNGDKMTIMDSRTNKPYESWTWISDIRYAMYKIKQGVEREQGTKDTYFFFNGLKPGNIMEYADIMHGAIKEGYCANADGSKLTQYWYDQEMCKQNINDAILGEDQGIWPIFMMGLVPEKQNEKQAAYYSLATALLSTKGPDTNMYFDTYSIKGFNNWPGFNLPLSMFIPESRYEEIIDGVLFRDFQKAKVYVNIADSTKNIDFGGSYYYLTDDGYKSTSKISSTNLGPNRAIIIYK